MEEGHHHENAVLAAQPKEELGIERVVERFSVWEERAFGKTRRARGVHQDHRVIGGDRGDLRDRRGCSERSLVGVGGVVRVGDGSEKRARFEVGARRRHQLARVASCRRAETSASARSWRISGAARRVLSGRAIAPSRAAANTTSRKALRFPTKSATRSPRPTPRERSQPGAARTTGLEIGVREAALALDHRHPRAGRRGAAREPSPRVVERARGCGAGSDHAGGLP